jgi:biopolymer transport protein ExbB
MSRSGVRGADNEEQRRIGNWEMQTDRRAQSLSQIRASWRLRPHAVATFAAALLISALVVHSARAQGTSGTPPAQPAAPAVTAPAAPPSTPAVQPSAASPSVTAPAATAPAGQTPAATAPAENSLTGTGNAPNNPSAATPTPPPGEPSVGGELLPQKLSFERMYLDADRVVKAVMIGLALASLVTWTVFLAKTLELRKARSDVRRGLRVLLEAVTLAQAHDQLREDSSPVAQLMQAAGQEIRLSANAIGDGLKERIALQLERVEMAISRKISRGTGVLATIGSTAVFVGLFGTVWGIMNSFIGISNAHTTNLAVVAPGIAQALLATAMGLIAAIPAVVIYNVLTRQTAHYRALLGDASAQIIRLVSRDLDRARLPLAQAAE